MTNIRTEIVESVARVAGGANFAEGIDAFFAERPSVFGVK